MRRLQKLDAMSKHYDKDKVTLLKALLDIRKEIDLLMEIKDTRDEINIILSLLCVQQKLVEKMHKNSDRGPILPGDSTIDSMIENDIAEFERMDYQAKNVQDKVRDC